jgi:hypothetical protein
MKMKHKKSHKSKHTGEHLTTESTNGVASSPPPEDDESRSSKRKRDSESGHKKNKKKRQEAENDANDESTIRDANEMSDYKVDQGQTVDDNVILKNQSPKDTRESVQNGSGDAPVPKSSPDPTSDATPSGGRLRKVRSFRIGGKDQLKVGFFLEGEVKALEDFKIQFCNTHGIEGRTFDVMIQHSERGGDEWPVPTNICTKADFWNDVYALIPDRDRRSVYRFMRRHFQDTTQKAHDWTPEQDEELIKLHAQHGPKYANIAKLLGRSDDDVTQRWKNRLQHRATKQTGVWSEAELRAFVSSLEEYRTLLIASSAEPENAGKDIWEMDLKSISWGSISNGMENSRTRQQCADKWRKISKNIISLRQTINPDAVFDPAEAARKHHRWNPTAANGKSRAFVEEEEDDDDASENEDEETRIPSTTPVIIPKLEFAAEYQTVDLAQVAKESSPESSPSRGDIQVDGTYSTDKSTERKRADAEESDDDEAAAPSSPISEDSRSEEKKLREERKERKRKKREKKERKRREAEAAAEDAEEDAPITPKEKQHSTKKSRKSGANGSEMNGIEQLESSKKKSKRDKKKDKKAAQGDERADDMSDFETSMVV